MSKRNKEVFDLKNSIIAILCVLVIGAVVSWHLRQGLKTYDDEKLALVDTHVAQTRKSYLVTTSPRQTVSHRNGDCLTSDHGKINVQSNTPKQFVRRVQQVWRRETLLCFISNSRREWKFMQVLIHWTLSSNESQLTIKINSFGSIEDRFAYKPTWCTGSETFRRKVRNGFIYNNSPQFNQTNRTNEYPTRTMPPPLQCRQFVSWLRRFFAPDFWSPNRFLMGHNEDGAH